MKTVMVFDAQGGGMGKQLIGAIRKEVDDVHVIAVGTNSSATSAMLKAGADEGATGENAVVVTSRKADIIIGPMGMLIADSMLGEVTEKMSLAIARADAKLIIIPFRHCGTYIAGVGDFGLAHLIEEAVRQLKEEKDF